MDRMTNLFSSFISKYPDPLNSQGRTSIVVLFVALGLSGCGGDSNNTPSAPAAVITSPAPSAFIHAGTTVDMTIAVEGEACDSVNPIARVTLNGSASTLSGSGDCRSFSADLNSTWGLNVVKGLIANDNGNEVALVQSYIRSGEFLAPTTATTARSSRGIAIDGIADAFRIRLGQEAIDDGDARDPDDLVTVINLALEDQIGLINDYLNSYLDNLLPDLIYDSVTETSHTCLLQTRVNREGVNFRRDGALRVDYLLLDSLTTADGEVYVDLIVGPITLPLAVDGYLDNGCLGELTAGATGAVGIQGGTISATLSVDEVGNLQIQFVDVSLKPAIVDIELDGLTGWFANFVSNQLEEVADFFLPAVEPWLLLLMEDYLVPLLEPYIGLNVFFTESLNEPILGVNLVLDAQTGVAEVREGFIDYGVTTKVQPSVYTKTSDELAAGTIIGSSTLPAFDGMKGSFGLGLKHDFINQIFWALWAGGAFDFEDVTDTTIDTLNAELEVPGVTVTSMEMTLPPVLMPGDNDAQVKIGVGGIVLSANLEQSSPSLFAGQPIITVDVPLTVHVAIFFTATLGLTPDRGIDFNISNQAEVEVQIVDAVRTDEIIALESELAAATQTVVERLIREDVGWNTPLLELPFEPAVPVTWYLDNGVLDQAEGYLRIIGSVGVRE